MRSGWMDGWMKRMSEGGRMDGWMDGDDDE